jgi:hypothetical protein
VPLEFFFDFWDPPSEEQASSTYFYSFHILFFRHLIWVLSVSDAPCPAIQLPEHRIAGASGDLLPSSELPA